MTPRYGGKSDLFCIVRSKEFMAEAAIPYRRQGLTIDGRWRRGNLGSR